MSDVTLGWGHSVHSHSSTEFEPSVVTSLVIHPLLCPMECTLLNIIASLACSPLWNDQGINNI